MPSPDERPGRRFNFGRLAPVAILLAGLGLFFAFGLHRHVSLDTITENRDWLRSQLAANAFAVGAAFLVSYALASAFSIPGAVFFTITGGFLFGPWVGASLSVVGATIGAICVFLAARTAFYDFFHAKAGPALRKMEAGFQDDAFSYLLVLRFIPLFPFWLVNIVPALLGVSLRIYVPATFLGIIPGALVYSFVGDGIDEVLAQGNDIDVGIIFSPTILAAILGLVLLALVPVVYKRFKAQQAASSPSSND